MKRAIHTHICFANGCYTPIHESALMCPGHLEMLHASLRLRLESAWEAGKPLIDQGEAYCLAAAGAIELVAEIERKPPRNLFRARYETLMSLGSAGPLVTAADLPASDTPPGRGGGV